MKLYLPYEPPLDWAFFLHYLENRRTAGVDAVEGERYSRTFALNGDVGTFTVGNEPERRRLVVAIAGDANRHGAVIEARLRRMFDLDLDEAAVRKTFAGDAWLMRLRRAYPGIRVIGTWSPFELLVRTIVGQQVSVKAATTIMGRIIDRTVGAAADEVGRAPVGNLFPTPRAIAGADFSAIGMPGRRAHALQNVARLIADEAIPFPSADALPDEVDVVAVKNALLKLPGIGPWTVEYFALRALGDRDAWPGTDLILRRGLQQHPDASDLSGRAIAENWRPHRAYAAMHLWHAATQAD